MRWVGLVNGGRNFSTSSSGGTFVTFLPAYNSDLLPQMQGRARHSVLPLKISPKPVTRSSREAVHGRPCICGRSSAGSLGRYTSSFQNRLSEERHLLWIYNGYFGHAQYLIVLFPDPLWQISCSTCSASVDSVIKVKYKYTLNLTMH